LASSERGSFLDLSLKEFLDAVPARTPAPGGGAVASVAASLAAGLAAMAARFATESWERRAEVVGRAEELRARVEPLADADAAAYAAYLGSRSPEATERIVEIPHEIVEIAAELAELAEAVARDGNPNVRGDAAAGAELAAAAAAIGARLVRLNAGPDDRRTTATAELAARAAAAAKRVDETDD
jgi:formiminotetrahydrofolate cyclodeaminase